MIDMPSDRASRRIRRALVLAVGGVVVLLDGHFGPECQLVGGETA